MLPNWARWATPRRERLRRADRRICARRPQRAATDAQSVTAALLGLAPVGSALGTTGDLYSWLAAALAPVYAVRPPTRPAWTALTKVSPARAGACEVPAAAPA